MAGSFWGQLRFKHPWDTAFFWMWCGCNCTAKKTAVAVSVCSNRTANTDVAVCGSVAVLCKKNSKMLQDHSLKVRKTCDTCDTCDTCEKMSYISLGVLLFSCLDTCDICDTCEKMSHISLGVLLFSCLVLRYFVKKKDIAQKCGCNIFENILKKTCGTCGLVYAAVSVSHGRLRV